MIISPEERKYRTMELIEILQCPEMYMRARYFIFHEKGDEQYIEPETDEQGNIYAYKVLIWCPEIEDFMSPVYPVYWNRDGSCKADEEPEEESSHGIYSLKQLTSGDLLTYYYDVKRKVDFESTFFQFEPRSLACIVRCLISGTIVEGNKGYRSEFAQVTDVFIEGDKNGYWQTYQDFQNETEYYNQRRQEKPWTTRDEARYFTGYNWDTLPPMANPNQDPTES